MTTRAPTGWTEGRAEAVWAAHYSAVAGWVAGVSGDQQLAQAVVGDAYARLFSRRRRRVDARLYLYREALQELSRRGPWLSAPGPRWETAVALLCQAGLGVPDIACVVRRPEGRVAEVLGRLRVRELGRARDELSARCEPEPPSVVPRPRSHDDAGADHQVRSRRTRG